MSLQLLHTCTDRKNRKITIRENCSGISQMQKITPKNLKFRSTEKFFCSCCCESENITSVWSEEETHSSALKWTQLSFLLLLVLPVWHVAVWTTSRKQTRPKPLFICHQTNCQPQKQKHHNLKLCYIQVSGPVHSIWNQENTTLRCELCPVLQVGEDGEVMRGNKELQWSADRDL